MIYDAADKAIKAMNRANLKAFGKLKLAKFDEIHVIREVTEVYAGSIRRAKRKYREIWYDAFFWMLVELGWEEARARAEAESAAAEAVNEMLERVDPVTLYEFAAESERKRDRLIEALAVAHDKSREIDRALRAWTWQVRQYADNCVFYGRRQAMETAGVRRVRWHTQEDDRVCRDCVPLDLRVFPVNEAPDCPMHPFCRCWLEPVD